MALAESLADLIPDAKDIRLLVIEAAIPLEYVTLTGSPSSNWRSVLDTAEAQGKWPRLIVSILQRYPEHTLLWRALGERAGIAMPPHVDEAQQVTEQSVDEMAPDTQRNGNYYVTWPQLAEMERRVMAKIEEVNEERRTDAAERDHELRRELQRIVLAQTGMSSRALWAIVILALVAMIALTGYMFYAASVSRFVPPLSSVWEGFIARWQP